MPSLKLMPLIDTSIVERLTSRENLQKWIDRAGDLAVSLVTAAIVLAVTFWLSSVVANFVRKSLRRFNEGHHLDNTLSNFLSNLVRYAILIVGLVAVLQTLGVKTTSILAVLGAASIAVGLALQGALSNVAAGVMLLLLRPYRLDDLVEISGKKGKVRNLDLFVTELVSPDGLRLFMPNSKVLGDMIINYTASGRRRMELKFGIDYGDDVDKALALMLEQASEEKRIFKAPAPIAKVTALQDFSVTVTLYAWTSATDIFEAEPDMIKRIKQAFEGAGLTFPYPHQVGLTRAEQAAIRPPERTPAPNPEPGVSPAPDSTPSSRRKR